MKNMTKRDVADIAMTWLLLTLIISLLTALTGLVFILFMREGQFVSRAIAVLTQLAYVFGLLALLWLLLFKRKRVIDFLFPEADKSTFTLPDEGHLLASYAFWIRLLGIIKCLSSGIKFASHLAYGFAARLDYNVISRDYSRWRESGPELISVLLAILIIWKSEQIAHLLEKLGSSSKRHGQADN